MEETGKKKQSWVSGLVANNGIGVLEGLAMIAAFKIASSSYSKEDLELYGSRVISYVVDMANEM